MDHLYDNPNLTFAKMKEIMEAASNGELDAEEKVDGQNLFLSYSIPEKKAKGARNKGHYRTGGIDATALAQAFAGRGGILNAFTGGFSAFEQAVEALSDEEKLKIFGPNANVWYNAEVMDPGSKLESGADNPHDPGATNIIKYDNKTLKIHDVGHFIYDPKTGEELPVPKGSLERLDAAMDRMKEKLHGHDFSLARRAVIQLQKLEDGVALNRATSQIDRALGAENLSDTATIQDYTFSRLLNGVDAELPPRLKEELVKYLLKLPGNIGLVALKKNLNPEDLRDLQDIVANKKMLLQEAIFPIEMAVHNFTVEILKGLKSVFIANTDQEVERLKNELAITVKKAQEEGPDNPQAMKFLQKQLNKIRDFSQITTPVEAVVFDYDGHTYKFAGNFAPLNQIIGMFKYPKGDKKIKTESVNFNSQIITDKKGKKVALLPGGFKPPHAGHYGLAKLLSSQPDIDEVVVIVGKNPRFSDLEPKISVTAEQSKDLWDLYTMKDENINVRIQKGKTPVSDVYDLIADKNYFSEGDTVILGKSDKDVGDTRYARAQSYAEMHNPGVNVEEMVFPVIGGKGMGGTSLRNMIAADQKEKFISKLPKHLNKSDLEYAWGLTSGRSDETLNKFIDQTIEEISAMSAGSVQGSSGIHGFGRPNSYNSYKRATKPKVKRAKRQRRR